MSPSTSRLRRRRPSTRRSVWMLHGQQQLCEPQLANVVPKATPIRASSHPHLLTRVACSSDSATTNSLRTSFCWTSAASRTQLSKRCFPNRNLLRLHPREQPKSPVSEEGGDSSVHSTAPDLHDVHTHLGTGSRVSRHGGSVVNSYLTRISVK